MVQIPAGDFMMGTNDGKADEKPVHSVHVNAFEMDVTEVTVAQYRACVSTGVCPAGSTTMSEFCNYEKTDKGNHPINCVSWDEARTYCVWAKKRLPTEEEWEYAARGTDGRKYPWGSDAPRAQLCWDRLHGKLGTCAVGSFPSGRSPFGLLDMAGNVWEWTASGYSRGYGESRSSSVRVLRGGAWNNDNPSYVGSAYRAWPASSSRDADYGFRCAR
jgi:formylglycine-generating enzyme required for sulfatase activity